MIIKPEHQLSRETLEELSKVLASVTTYQHLEYLIFANLYLQCVRWGMNKTQASEHLGLNRTTLVERCGKLGLKEKATYVKRRPAASANVI